MCAGGPPPPVELRLGKPSRLITLGRRSGCLTVNQVSQNKPEATTGALPAPPTSLRSRAASSFGSAGQLGFGFRNSRHEKMVASLPRRSGQREGGCNSLRVRQFLTTNLTAGRRPGTERLAANENKPPAPFRIAPGQTARSVAATCSVRDGVIAGATPAALTIFFYGV